MSSPISQLKLRAGEERTLELPGLATAGYVWEDELGGEPGVVEVRWERGLPAGAAPQPVGASAPERATIRALRPGAALVTLVQRRRWEPPERARERRAIEVTVS